MGLKISGAIVRSDHERRVLVAALEAYGRACVDGIFAAARAGSEEAKLEYAMRYDHAQTMLERVAGLA